MKSLRFKLATAFHICALKGWDNWTYTHISAREPGSTSFLMNPFDLLFKDITPSSLVSIDMTRSMEANLSATSVPINPTGILIHSAIYKKRPDINAIFHLHTPYGVSVSCMEGGLLPMSQFALHFYDNISTHPYDSLVLDEHTQTDQLAKDLGENHAILLQNHGTITVGSTIEEAFFFTHHLEEACRVQCLTLNANTAYHLPDQAVCQKAAHDLLTFEKQRGLRDWTAAQTLIPPAIRDAWMNESDSK